MDYLIRLTSRKQMLKHRDFSAQFIDTKHRRVEASVKSTKK